jgi:nucleoside-diphosphate-sugar epimerase
VSVYVASSRRDFDEECATWQVSGPPYGWSKAEGERIVRASELGWTIVRPVIVLSLHPRSYWGPLALQRARELEAPVLGLAEVPYVHVDNLVTAIELAATTDAALGRSYDVIDGAGDTRAYLAALYGALGREVPLLPEETPRVTFAGTRLRRELGWAPPDRWAEFLRALAALPA